MKLLKKVLVGLLLAVGSTASLSAPGVIVSIRGLRHWPENTQRKVGGCLFALSAVLIPGFLFCLFLTIQAAANIRI